VNPLQRSIKMTSVNFQRLRSWAALLAMAVALVACGGGDGGGGGDAQATVSSISGPSRAVTDTRYSYQASASDAGGINWNWGDGTPDSSGASVQKVWRKAGSFNARINATSLSVAVVGEPISGSAPFGSGSSAHTCALKANGSAMCWGRNLEGQLGNGTTTAALSPVAVTGLSDAVALSAGAVHTCALKTSGSVVCWGNNGDGRLGNGTTTTALSPVAVTGLSDALAVSAGTAHTCALKASGSVACWGNNGDGRLGNNTTSTAVVSPVTVNGLSDAVAVSVGNAHTCAIKASGAVVCWGDNRDGQLGNGTTTAAISPVAVTGLSDAVALSLGEFHTCALKASGSVVCWGNDFFGQLGDGDRSSKYTPAVAVAGLSDAVAVSAGRGHTCALKASGSVVCWGEDRRGELGNGGKTPGLDTDTPIAVTGLADAVAISAGAYHTCALQASGNAFCWGYNIGGEIGDGTTGNKRVPTPVTGGAIFWK
jgi:alpha-tubulin suppressor-like RCC1 family protein